MATDLLDNRRRPSPLSRLDGPVLWRPVVSSTDGRGLKTKDIQKKYDKEIQAELDCRGIDYPKDEHGDLNTFDQLSMKEKSDLFKIDQ